MNVPECLDAGAGDARWAVQLGVANNPLLHTDRVAVVQSISALDWRSE